MLGQSIDNPPVPDEQQPHYQLLSLLLKVRRSNYDPLISAQATPALQEAIDAAKQAPSEAQWFIARFLLGFNDPKAQAAADELITDKKVLEADKQLAKAKGARGLW